MDGLFHGKPYEQMDDLGVPLFLETTISQLKQAFIQRPSRFLVVLGDVLPLIIPASGSV